ncbi:DUF4365 domain-containing protein [Streptomyces stramineus]|uniref:DUF4365 domain-containing protein n=1 Tax=Streptomyces stramineus TaxID=173861 RepID=A0ABN0ZQB6_9ACTN
MSEEVFRRGGIPADAHKERASYHALALLANSAGCYLSSPELDYDCLDVTVIASGPRRVRRCRFDVQLKASSSRHTVRQYVNGDFSIRLPADQYEELRAVGVVPMRLVVLILPPGTDIPQFKTEPKSLRLDGIMLWSDPDGWPALAAGQRYGTVRLPRENEFTTEYIRSLMKILSDGGGQ